MPGTARGMGLRNPFDPAQAIDAQAHLMRDLLRRFGSVPLALAAYNAGPGRWAAAAAYRRTRRREQRRDRFEQASASGEGGIRTREGV